jgi:hypothetical protein
LCAAYPEENRLAAVLSRYLLTGQGVAAGFSFLPEVFSSGTPNALLLSHQRPNEKLREFSGGRRDITKLARGAFDGIKSDGYLALAAWLATMGCGASKAPVFLRGPRFAGVFTPFFCQTPPPPPGK